MWTTRGVRTTAPELITAPLNEKSVEWGTRDLKPHCVFAQCRGPSLTLRMTLSTQGGYIYHGTALDTITSFEGRSFPRIQILTIEEILAGKQIEFQSMRDATFKQAPKAKAKKAENLTLDLG